MTAMNTADGSGGKGNFFAHVSVVLSSQFPIYRPLAHFLRRKCFHERQVNEMDLDLLFINSLEDLPWVEALTMDLQGGGHL